MALTSFLQERRHTGARYPDRVTAPIASTDDVRSLLGPIGNRLPDFVDLDTFLDLAHGVVVDELSKVYPSQIPTFEGNGLTAVRWAEAKLATADVLDAIRVNLRDRSLEDTPDRYRASALATLRDGVVGYPVGGESIDDDDDPLTPGVNTTPRPRVSSFTPLSAFPDPYEALRDEAVGYQ